MILPLIFLLGKKGLKGTSCYFRELVLCPLILQVGSSIIIRKKYWLATVASLDYMMRDVGYNYPGHSCHWISLLIILQSVNGVMVAVPGFFAVPGIAETCVRPI